MSSEIEVGYHWAKLKTDDTRRWWVVRVFKLGGDLMFSQTDGIKDALPVRDLLQRGPYMGPEGRRAGAQRVCRRCRSVANELLDGFCWDCVRRIIGLRKAI